MHYSSYSTFDIRHRAKRDKTKEMSMENILSIIWLVLVAVFCIAGVVGIVRRIRRTEANAEEFRHAAEDGIIDSNDFPRDPE